MARKNSDASVGTPTAKSRWYRQLWLAYRMTREVDPAVLWWMVSALVGTLVVFLVIGVLAKSLAFWLIMGLPFGLLGATVILARRAEKAAYSRLEGQPGASLAALGTIRRGWEFGARFRVVSGPLTTPAVSPPDLPALFVADAGAYAPLQGRAFSRRLPLFHQLDIRIDKRWQFRTWRFSAYLDVQNVYNNAAVEGLAYNYNFSQEQYQTGIPIIPSLGMRGEF